MFAAILQIAVVCIILGGLVYFVVTYWDYIATAFSWGVEVLQSLSGLCPSWVAWVVAVMLLLAAVGIIIKVV